VVVRLKAHGAAAFNAYKGMGLRYLAIAPNTNAEAVIIAKHLIQ
jgi:hypothetical protein